MTDLKAGKNNVEIFRVSSRIVANLYCPDDFDNNKQNPAIVVGGPFATVKEQASGFYAKKLAAILHERIKIREFAGNGR